MEASDLPIEDQRKLLIELLGRRARVAPTVARHLRRVRHFVDWVAARGRRLNDLTEIDLKLYLDSPRERGRTVPGAGYSALHWWNEALLFGWPLADDSTCPRWCGRLGGPGRK